VSAQETTFSPAGSPATPVAGPCPPWCEIEDHDDFDDGQMQHMASTNVGLSAYPYEVTCTSSGRPAVTQHTDSLMVSRSRLRDRAPAIVITLPGMLAGPGQCTDPDGHVSCPDGQALLTFAEAQDTAVALLVMAGRADGSPHLACALGDPSPCCAGAALRQFTCQAAVFCPGCGSLYWKR
jgi:hypothetical protein